MDEVLGVRIIVVQIRETICQNLSMRSTFKQVQLLNLNPLIGAN